MNDTNPTSKQRLTDAECREVLAHIEAREWFGLTNDDVRMFDDLINNARRGAVGPCETAASNQEIIGKLNVWIRHLGSGTGIRNESTRGRILEDLRTAVVSLSPDETTACQKCEGWKQALCLEVHQVTHLRAALKKIVKRYDGFTSAKEMMQWAREALSSSPEAS